MANVLTDLAADIYTAVDIVAREYPGFVRSCTINANGSQRAAVGDTIRAHFAPSVSTVTRTSAMAIPEGTDQNISNKTVTINKDKAVLIPWTGEDMRSVNNGAGFETIYGDQVAQAMRSLINEMESDLASAAYLGSSRAYGTAGTTPFGTQGDFTDAAGVFSILKENGAPSTDCRLVVNHAAGVKLFGLQMRYNVTGQTPGYDAEVVRMAGLEIRESGFVQTHTKGTASGATTNNAGYAIGATTITLASAGTGTILAGDVITFAGDSNKYVVVTGDTDVSNGGTIVLAAPGLRQAIGTSATAITVVANSTRNIAFHKAAVELVVRPPAMPSGGDAAVDAMTVVDPYTGIPFEVRAYKGFGKAMFVVSACWGVKAWKTECIAALLG